MSSSSLKIDSSDILIQGKITNSVGGEGIDSVKIEVSNSCARTFTRENGKYELLVKGNKKKDILYLLLNKANYPPKVIPLKIENRDRIECSIPLDPFYYGPSLSIALNLTVKGKVFSSCKSGGIIKNALIKAAETLDKTYSDASGNFSLSIENFVSTDPIDTLFLLVEKESYKPRVIIVPLQDRKKTYENRNVYLESIQPESLIFIFNISSCTESDTNKIPIDSALITHDGDTLGYTKNGYLNTKVNIKPDQNELEFDCSHKWFIKSTSKKVELDERTEYSVSIELSPIQCSAEVQIFDEKNNPVRNAKIMQHDQLIASTNKNGVAQISFHAIPKDTFHILTPRNFYSPQDTFFVIYPEKKIYFLNVNRKFLQARFTIIDSTSGQPISQHVKITSNAENWTYIETIHDTLVYNFFAQPGDKVIYKIQRPDYNSKTDTIPIEEKKKNYFLPPVFLSPKIYYGYLKILTNPDSVECKIFRNDSLISSLIAPDSLRLPEDKYKLVFSKEYYDTLEDSIEILRDQINLKAINLSRSFGVLKVLVKAEDEDVGSINEISIKNNITAEDLAKKWNKKKILGIYQINKRAYFGKYTLRIRKEDYIDIDSLFTIETRDTIEIKKNLHKKRKTINFIVDPEGQYYICIDKDIEILTDSSGYVRIPGLKFGKHNFVIRLRNCNNEQVNICQKRIIENKRTYRVKFLAQPNITNPPIFSNITAISPIETRERRYFLINMGGNYSPQLLREESLFTDILIYYLFKREYDIGCKIPTLINIKEGDYYVEEYQPFVKFYLMSTQRTDLGLHSQFSIPYISKNRNFSRGKPNIELRLLYSRKDIIKWEFKDHLHINLGWSSNRISKTIKQSVSISDYSFLLFGFKYELYFNKNLALVTDTYSLYSLPFNQGINLKMSILCQWRLKPTLFLYAGFSQKYINLYGDKMPLLPYEKAGRLYAGLVTLIQ